MNEALYNEAIIDGVKTAMQIRVLGCSGGIGGALRTSSFLLDDDILLDAGTGIGDLSIDALAKIDHIFITHSHIDHILGIPLIADTVQSKRSHPITVYALEETIRSIKTHLFNWVLWPDFTELPSKTKPCIRFVAIHAGESVTLNTRTISALPVDHAVPGVGYLVHSGKASLAYSGDTTSHAPFWAALNKAAQLDYLIVETSFGDKEEALAIESKHYNPKMLCQDLASLNSRPEVLITHLKPDQEALIMQEFELHAPRQRIKQLTHGSVWTF
jgi:ribonuclease BN (tRNA processing enzyme)